MSANTLDSETLPGPMTSMGLEPELLLSNRFKNALPLSHNLLLNWFVVRRLLGYNEKNKLSSTQVVDFNSFYFGNNFDYTWS